MNTLLQDLRYSVRTLLKTPSFTIVAVLALALGIGANAAIFSVVNGVLIKPLPYHDQDRIVRVFAQFLGQDMPKSNMSPPEFFDFKGKNRVFDEIAAYSDWKVNLTGVADPERLRATYATASLWRILGVSATLGRTFTNEEDQKGHDTVVVLSHDLWQQRFGSDPKILGKILTLGGQPFEVVGVMPEWVPLPLQGGAALAAVRIRRRGPGGAQRPLREHPRPAEARGLAPAGPGRGVRDRASDPGREPEERFLSPLQRLGCPGRPLKEEIVGEIRPALLGAPRRRQLRPADRLCQRRQSPPGAGRRPAA